jgi:hypothetical protein
MRGISCVKCGLKNWLEEGECKRCGEPLAFIEEVGWRDAERDHGRGELYAVSREEIPTTCSFCGARGFGTCCPVCRKQLKPLKTNIASGKGRFRRFLSSANGIAASMLIVAIAATGVAYGVAWKRADSALAVKAKFAHAIREAQDFKAPVYVSFEEDSKELAPGVRLLMEKGLVSFRTGTTPRTIHVEEVDKETGELVRHDREDPNGGRPYAHVDLTSRGATESVNWKRLAADSRPSPGWSVPLGTRELIEVVEIRQSRPLTHEEYERVPLELRASIQPSDIFVTVPFTWRWKPDELGRYFDVSSDDHRSLSAPAQESARAFSTNDSTKVRVAIGLFVYRDGQPFVKGVLFEENNTQRD